jgi:4'-phosphopantetheinyl transferase
MRMPGRVILLHVADPGLWAPGRVDAALDRLPAFMREEILRSQRQADRQARILGRLLLRAGLLRLGLHRDAPLAAWTRDASGRPRLLDCPADFSISHSGGLVLCALTMAGRLGVDVERRARMKNLELRAAFGDGEWADILASTDPSLTALRLWTIKEAALKADGRGLSIEPSKIDARPGSVFMAGIRWIISEPAVSPGWVCSLATNWRPSEIEILGSDIALLASDAVPRMLPVLQAGHRVPSTPLGPCPRIPPWSKSS